jgi:hypothetical protein
VAETSNDGGNDVMLCMQLLAIMTTMYTIEPLLGRIYVSRSIRALERVLTTVRMEVFRILLMQPIGFFDRHGPTELTNVLAVDLDTIRSCIFGCARTRDRAHSACSTASHF